jgi:RNA polymerase sigma-70 factor (ECF subfamily)
MAPIEEEKGRIADCLRGDQEAFEALVLEYQQMIHSLCCRMTGSAADASDMAQETFIHAYQHLADFRAESRFSSWLYRIAVNQCLNWQKRERRREKLQLDLTSQDSGSAEHPNPLARQVQEALMKLNPAQRAAVVLTTYDGLTHAEAAAALGCSETTVSWRVFMARAKLKRLLKGIERS